jgi:hypothetical protein
MYVYYHGWAETPWNVDLDVMAGAVAELDTVLAQVASASAAQHNFSAAASCDSQSIESAVAWDDPHVVSGLRSNLQGPCYKRHCAAVARDISVAAKSWLGY